MKITATLLLALPLFLAATARAESPATRPATRPTTRPTTQPATQPATRPADADADDSQPGPGQARLEAFVGTFDATIKSRSAPGEKWDTVKGIERNAMILGGRFLQTAWIIQDPDHPVHGVTLTGYDPQTKTYTAISAEDAALTFYTQTGPASADGKTLALTDEDGLRTDLILTKTGYAYHIYEKDERDKAFLASEITCVRK